MRKQTMIFAFSQFKPAQNVEAGPISNKNAVKIVIIYGSQVLCNHQENLIDCINVYSVFIVLCFEIVQSPVVSTAKTISFIQWFF